MILETERLILREMDQNDYDALYAVLADSDMMEHYPYTFDEARVRNWITRNMERYSKYGFGLWAVALKETGEMIGDCGITMQPIHGQWLPEIGYHIRKDQQRKGYASEAAAACIRFAFEKHGFSAVYSYMKHTNIPSQRTAMKNGMWYVSLAILIIDPLYLSVLSGFFGGGDMNGIKLLFPEIAARIVFAAIGIIHGVVIWKYLLPEYTKAFQE